MSFKIKKLTVGKGKTTGDEKASEWIKRYYEVELEIQDEHDIEIAKASVEGLIDGWLTGKSISESQREEKQTWDPTKITWTKAEGTKGEYERSEDINNLQFKAMLKDLASHGGRMTREGYFYWVFQSGSVVGRKLRGEKKTQEPQGVKPISTQLQSELEKVKQYFPMDLRELLMFEQKADVWIIKPRQFLGAGMFAKIGAAVKQHGGSWVSAGKESRFEIPKEK